jgi:DNA-binding transcriptional LysR family regulator
MSAILFVYTSCKALLLIFFENDRMREIIREDKEMDIRSLQYFVTIVECGNFSNAAKKLHMTQPPLSRQIQLLESELEVVLMERGPRNITLTDAGKKLYKYAQSMIDISNVAIQDISDFSDGKRGSLRIGVASSCNGFLLSIIAKDFSVRYPEITYQIFEKNTFELIELLDKNIIEIAILRSPFPNNTSFYSEVIAKERIVAIARPEFFGNDNLTFEISELNGKPIILYRRWETILRNYLDGINATPKYLCINDDARTSLAWAQEGMGIALLPSSTIYNIKDDTILCKSISQDSIETEISIAWKDSRYVSTALENFIDANCNNKLNIDS